MNLFGGVFRMACAIVVLLSGGLLPSSAIAQGASQETVHEAKATEKMPVLYPYATRQEPGLKASKNLLKVLKELQIKDEVKDYGGAIAQAKEIVNGSSANAYEQSFAYQIAGNAASDSGDDVGAMQYFEQALAENGLENNSHYTVMYNIAVLAFRLKQNDKTLRTLDRFIAETKSDKIEVQRLRAAVLFGLERYNEAGKLYSELLAAHPDNKAFRNNAAAAYQQANEPVKAAALLAGKPAEATAPDDASQSVDFGILKDLMAFLWVGENETWTDEGRLLVGVLEIGWPEGKRGKLLVINNRIVGDEKMVFQEVYGARPGTNDIFRVNTNIPFSDNTEVDLTTGPDGSVRFDYYEVSRNGQRRASGTMTYRLLPDGRLEAKTMESIAYFRPINRSNLPEIAVAVQERERQVKQDKAQQKRERSQAFWGGLYNAIQVTGAIINEDAERTQAELDATLARAAAQGEANQQAQVRQQQESQEQASAAQQGQSEQAERAAEEAESNRLRQQNADNLAKAKGYLQQAIDNDLDPTIVQGMREGVNTLEEALREDDSPSYSAASVDNDDTDDLAEQQEAEAQANAKREAAAKAAEEAKATRQAEAEAKAAERRAKDDLAKKEQQQKLANHLTAEQRGIRLRALTCPSGKGSYFVVGARPNVSPKVANCISVQFEARCPGTQRGQGVIDTFQNYVGGDSCVGDTIRIPEMACPADRVGVDVLDVATCS